MSKQRAFSRRAALTFLEIHKISPRPIALSGVAEGGVPLLSLSCIPLGRIACSLLTVILPGRLIGPVAGNRQGPRPIRKNQKLCNCFAAAFCSI